MPLISLDVYAPPPVKMHDAARAAFNQREDMKKIAIAALLCSFIATPVLAENLSPVYVEAGLGVASYEFQTSPRDVRIAAGLQFSPVWAVEVGGSYLGGANRLGVQPIYTLGVKTLQVALVGNYHVNNDASLIGKLGLTRNRAILGGNFQTLLATSVSDLYWAAGVDYHLNRNFAIRTLYEDFGSISKVTKINASAISVNLHYNF